MRKRYGPTAILLAAAMAMAGCSGVATGESAVDFSGETSVVSDSSAAMPHPEEAGAESTPTEEVVVSDVERESGPDYIEQVAREVAATIAEPDMTEYEKAKAAFDYIIANTSMTDPVGLELWRIRGSGDPKPSFVENRSLSVLLYGIGMCEDYAAAFTMLLRGMGLEAEYVPGLTYSAQGTGLVDHSWTVAKIDGVWYHLDPQLEDNISRHNTIHYKYFMRGDATMAGSHRWGQNLINVRLLTTEQNEEIAERYLYEPCPQDYPTPAPQTFTPAEAPDAEVLKAGIEAEIAAYEMEYGPLEPLELDIIPPVFGLEGYGPPE